MLENLQQKLEVMGLKPREYNEFIVYWLPKMQVNRHNLITFLMVEYEQQAKLKVTPQPDSKLRVWINILSWTNQKSKDLKEKVFV
ncbi:MAG: hypothetical protein GX270_14835 [Clostridiaceae bacterium]|nr:hypothetical protein [Clostridiaceae bacterium]